MQPVPDHPATGRSRALADGAAALKKAKLQVQSGCVEIDLDSGPFGPSLGVVRQRRLEPEIVERRGPEFQSQVVDLPADQARQCLERLKLVACPTRIGHLVLDDLEAKAERGQVLAHLVVKFAGDPPPFVFLGRSQPLLQVAAVGFSLFTADNFGFEMAVRLAQISRPLLHSRFQTLQCSCAARPPQPSGR